MKLTPEQEQLGRENFHEAVSSTRRQFLVGAAAAVPTLGAAYFGYGAIQGNPVKVGFIGTGDEGSVLLTQHPPEYMDIVACADLRPKNRVRALNGDGNDVRWGLIRKTSHLAGVIASELHADVKIARMGGLLHDIGKAVTHEIDGPHAIVGAEIAKRYGVNPKVINCIASHHGEVEPESIEAIIVAAADAISGARPGARRESLEAYVKRVTALEEIGNSFPGVSQTFAIQAGREVRVIVRPDDLDDLQVIELSKNIAKKIEDNLEYPGQIRVTVIRETRSVAHAK